MMVSFPANDDRVSCTDEHQVSHTVPNRSFSGHSRVTYLIERRHGLVGAADLHLKVRSFVTVAVLGGALNGVLLGIVPGSWPAKDILLLLAGELAARVQGLADGELVGARSALESVIASGHGGDGEDVCAGWTDWEDWPRLANRLSGSRRNLTHRAASWR